LKYASGTEINIGDRVRLLSNGDIGKVVASIETEEYTPEFPRKVWEHLEEGILIITDKSAVVHLDSSHSNMIVKL
jgi:hypothetical protein